MKVIEDLGTKANSTKVTEKAKAKQFMRMETFMKAIGNRINTMAMGIFSLTTVAHMSEILKMACMMVMVLERLQSIINLMSESNTKANILQVRFTA